MAHPFRIRRAFFLCVLAFALVGVPASGQNRAGVPAVPPPDRPVVLQTTDVARIRVVPSRRRALPSVGVGVPAERGHSRHRARQRHPACDP